MTAILCPKCREQAMTWSIDEDVSALTEWWCSGCGYIAQEDETNKSSCSICFKADSLALRDEADEYRWCTHCGGRSPL